MWHDEAMKPSLFICIPVLLIWQSWSIVFIILMIIFSYYYIGHWYQANTISQSIEKNYASSTDSQSLKEEDIHSEKIEKIQGVLGKNYIAESLIELLILEKGNQNSFLESSLYLSDIKNKTKEYIDVVSVDDFFTRSDILNINRFYKTKYFIYFVYNKNKYCCVIKKEYIPIFSILKNYFSKSGGNMNFVKYKLMAYFNSELIFKSSLPIKGIKNYSYSKSNKSTIIVKILNWILNIFKREIIQTKKPYVSPKNIYEYMYQSIEVAKLGDWVDEISGIRKLIYEKDAAIKEKNKQDIVNKHLAVKQDKENEYEKKYKKKKKEIEKDFDLGDF